MPLTKPLIIVDDDLEDRELMLEALKESTCNTDHLLLEDGQALIDYLSNHVNSELELPGFIILDYNLRKKNAQEVLEQIRTNDKLSSIPVIVLSSTLFPRHKEAVYKLGVACYRLKPSTYKELVQLFNAIELLWLRNERE